MISRKIIKLKLYSKLNNQTKEISNKKYKNKLPTYRNENLTANKTFQKLINYTYNSSKKYIKINKIKENKFNDKNSRAKIITKSNSKNKTHNIVVEIKINKTPLKSNIDRSIIKNLNYTAIKQNKFNSQINMHKFKNIYPNQKSKNYLNTNPKNLFKSSNNILKEKTFSKVKQTSLNRKINNEFYSQNSAINKNKNNFKKINIMNLFQYKIKKHYLSNENQKNIKENNTLNKITTTNYKSNENKSSGFLIVVSPTNKSKNINVNKSKKFRKINIEIHLK